MPGMEPKILLIATNPEIAEPLQAALKAYGNLTSVIGISSTADRAPRTEEFDLVIWLWETNQLDGNGSCAKFQSIDAIFLLGNPATTGKIQTFRNGVYNFSLGRLDADKLAATVKELLGQNGALPQKPTKAISEHIRSHLIGESPKIKEVHRSIERLSQLSNLMVLITGPTGAGKEVVARLLHHCSPRANKPFIPINCGAIPEALIESELFGYREGAFTGAKKAKKGLIEAAQGGTLFFDEISSLTLALQVKLLRFLQDRRYTPVGGTKEHQSNVTVVAATNEDLKALVAEGRFRGDLYARLKVFVINLPPLRERREDTLLLAQRFLAKYAAIHNVPEKILSEPAIELLQRYDWPQNVRELENLMLNLTVTVTDELILPEHLPVEIVGVKNEATREEIEIVSLDVMEKAHIMLALQASKFNVSQAANLL